MQDLPSPIHFRSTMMNVLRLIPAVLLPPVGVFFTVGLGWRNAGAGGPQLGATAVRRVVKSLDAWPGR